MCGLGQTPKITLLHGYETQALISGGAVLSYIGMAKERFHLFISNKDTAKKKGLYTLQK